MGGQLDEEIAQAWGDYLGNHRETANGLCALADRMTAMQLPDDRGWRVDVSAGKRGSETKMAGTPDEHEQIVWARRVEVYVSRTGRSVRVFVDGEEVKQ